MATLPLRLWFIAGLFLLEKMAPAARLVNHHHKKLKMESRPLKIMRLKTLMKLQGFGLLVEMHHIPNMNMHMMMMNKEMMVQ